MAIRTNWPLWALAAPLALLAIPGCARCTGRAYYTVLPDGGPDAGGSGGDSGSQTVSDSGARGDDAGPSDAGAARDAGMTDSGSTVDAGSGDAGPISSDVLMHRRNFSRDGVYVDPSMTKAAVVNMHVDLGFNATTSSNTFSQPLFMQNGPGGKNALFVATENNDVYALDATTGAQLWKTNVGAGALRSSQCGGSQFCGGSIDPYGISGTPAIDPVSRTLYLDAMLLVGKNGQPTHTLFALGIDVGNVVWSVDVDSTVSGFNSCIQNERSAVLLFKGRLYVVYGGLDGDCGSYKGWVIGVDTANPRSIVTWRTNAPSGSGIWGTSGAATDGTSLYVATTNTNSPFPTSWDAGHSEAVIRLAPDLTFTESAANFFAPSKDARNNNQDWYYNDTNDLDLGSSGVVLVDAPGATPSQLAFAVGKTQYAYLMDRNNLGGISPGVSAVIPGTDNQVFGSLLSYNTSKPATYVSGGRFNVSGAGFCASGSADFTVLEVTHTQPPNLKFAWCAQMGGDSAPIVSTTDAQGHEAILWTYGASGDEVVRAYDADTGAPLYTSPTLPGSTHWISPIIANGRFYVGQNGTVSALTVR